jgi:hypothetical protein
MSANVLISIHPVHDQKVALKRKNERESGK